MGTQSTWGTNAKKVTVSVLYWRFEDADPLPQDAQDARPHLPGPRPRRQAPLPRVGEPDVEADDQPGPAARADPRGPGCGEARRRAPGRRPAVARLREAAGQRHGAAVHREGALRVGEGG